MATSARGIHPGTLEQHAAEQAPGSGPFLASSADCLTRLLGSNLAFLAQGAQILERLDDSQYLILPAPFAQREGGSRGGIGGHVRHILDHYDSLLDGLAQARVDYSRRGRDRTVELERAKALAKLGQIKLRMRGLDVASDRPLAVALDSAPSPTELQVRWMPSSLARELQFLASHTVHHYAIIAILLRLLGIDPGRDFGVAPSTLEFERGNSACAR